MRLPVSWRLKCRRCWLWSPAMTGLGRWGWGLCRKPRRWWRIRRRGSPRGRRLGFRLWWVEVGLWLCGRGRTFLVFLTGLVRWRGCGEFGGVSPMWGGLCDVCVYWIWWKYFQKLTRKWSDEKVRSCCFIKGYLSHFHHDDIISPHGRDMQVNEG